MTPYTVKTCKLPPLQLPSQLTVSKVLQCISKTLETDSVSQESHSFKPCTKAEIDFVEIKCPVFNAVCIRV